MNHLRSSELFEGAQKSIPGGVNSPARAFRAVGRDPVFISRAEGSRIWDVDGNEYIDYVGSWGPMLLGHQHPVVLEALKSALKQGISYGAPTEAEIEMAELVIEIVPSIEMVRLVNSGTEATMSALRVARGYTSRDLVVKFIGNYHGHVDSLLVKAGSGLATLGISDSDGVPAAFATLHCHCHITMLKLLNRYSVIVVVKLLLSFLNQLSATWGACHRKNSS